MVLIGLTGVVLVLVPGMSLQIIAVGIWAFAESSAMGWVVAATTLTVAVVATVLKYLHPGRRLKAAGMSNRLLFLAVLVGVVGFFLVPVVGGPLGFVLTIYGFERRRLGRAAAWPSTRVALRAVAASVGIELAGAFLIAAVFLVGAVVA